MKSPLMKATGRMASRFVATFDSASSFVRELSSYLKGRPPVGLGGMAPPSDKLAFLLNRLPADVLRPMYIWGGAAEGIPSSKLGEVRAEEISKFVVNSYPERTYPAVVIGSSSGALVHLAAALGIPWLPQTMLIPVRREQVHADEPDPDLDFARQAAKPLLEATPSFSYTTCSTRTRTA